MHEKDQDYNTPLHLATQHKQTDTIKVILDHLGTYHNYSIQYIVEKNNFGWSPFSGAVAKGNYETVREMLKGLSIANKRSLMEEKDNNNSYAIHLAAKYGHVEVFTLLLDNNANIMKQGPDQKTALDIAIEKEQRTVMRPCKHPHRP